MAQKLPLAVGTLHFIGIGGIGMSGIAEALNYMGYDVQGSDIKESANVERLRNKGITVHIGHNEDNILDSKGAPVAAVVYSTAVKQNNAEMQAALKHHVPTIRRAEMLAELMRLKPSIAVAGTHGKTTTTSLVGHVLDACGCDPTIINGGIINAYNSNTRMGDGTWMVVEADESDGTFTMLPALAGIITNIDPEHMDHYDSFDEIKSSFKRFVKNLPFYGRVAVCIDHETVRELLPEFTRQTITYGQSEDADLRLVNLRTGEGGQIFDIIYNGVTYTDFIFPMFGLHNVLNACAAIAIAHETGLEIEHIKTALSSFNGVKRRFTKTGEVNGITIIDDYGHHPIEISAVLKAAREAISSSQNKQGCVIAVAQPHRYTRLQSLFDDFASCFDLADHVIISDVYAAGEAPIEGVSKESLVKAIGDKAVALPSEDALSGLIADIAKPGDFVICLGAGTITTWANALPSKLEDFFSKSKSNGTHG